MPSVPVEFECQHNGSAEALHGCTRVSTDVAHKALAPSSSQFGWWSSREGPMVRIRLPPPLSHMQTSVFKTVAEFLAMLGLTASAVRMAVLLLEASDKCNP